MSINPIYKHGGRRLQLRRLEVQLSQTDLAIKLGPRVGRQTISAYEAGNLPIGAAALYLISKVLDCSVLYFFEGLGLEEGKGNDHA